MHRRVLTSVFLGLMASSALAETIAIVPVEVTEWKAVYGRIEARDRVPARARIGGTLVELAVSEGDVVTEGQLLATIVEKSWASRLPRLPRSNRPFRRSW